MAAQVVLVEARPRRVADGMAQPVRLAGGGALKPYRYPDLAGGADQDWKAGILRLPPIVAQLDFDGTDLGTGGVPQATEIQWGPARRADLDALSGLFWGDAPIVVRIGPEGVSPPKVVAGRVLSATVADGVLKLVLADPAAALKKSVPLTRFAGTGDLEGPAEWSGKLKERVWGRVWNKPGDPIDKANNIYAFADPARPLQAIDAVRDKGAAAAALVDLAWQGSIAATLAALRAAIAPQGGGVRCPSIACVKWWTQPAGDLTADLRGEIGAGYVETTAEIAARIVSTVAGPAFAAGVVATAAGWRPAPIGWVADDETTPIATMLDRLFGNVSLLWVLDQGGEIAVRKWEWGASVAIARSHKVSRLDSYRPVHTRKIGYKRNELPMARGELAAILLASDATYLDGTPVEALKPAAPGATKNIVTRGAAAPASPTDGDIWVDTSVTPAIARVRIVGTWRIASNYVTQGSDIGVENGATAGASILRGATTFDGWTIGAPAQKVAGVSGTDPAQFVVRVADASASLSSPIIDLPANANRFYFSLQAKGSAASAGGYIVGQAYFYTATGAFNGAVVLPTFYPFSTAYVLWSVLLTVPAGTAKIQFFLYPQPNAGFTLTCALPAVTDSELGSRAGADLDAGLVSGGSALNKNVLLNSSIVTNADGTTSFFNGTVWINIGQVTAPGLGVEAGSDLSKVVVADVPGDIEIAYNYDGTAKTGELPKARVFRLKTAEGITISSGVAWAWSTTSGTGTVTTTGAGSVSLACTALTSNELSGTLTASYAGKTYTTTAKFKKKTDLAPTTGGGGSGGGGSAQANISGSITSTSYTQIASFDVVAGAGGTINLAAPNCSLTPTSNQGIGSTDIAFKWQWNNGGTWTDVGAVSYSDPDPFWAYDSEFGAFYPEPGSISCAASHTGRTNGVSYSYRLMAAHASGTTRAIAPAGQATGVAT